MRWSSDGRVTAVALGAVALVASACGGPTGQPAPASSASAASPTDSGFVVVKQIQSRGSLRVAVVPAAPLVFSDPATPNDWKGIFIEEAKAIAAALNVKVEYVGADLATIVAGLQSGKYDLAPALNITPERLQAIDFTIPVYSEFSAYDISPTRSDITSWDQLNNSANAICVAQGSVQDTTLAISQSGKNFTLSFANWPKSIGSGRVEGTKLTASLIPPDLWTSQAGCGSGRELSIVATIDGKATSRSLLGTLSVNDCPSCATVRFNGFRQAPPAKGER